MARKYLIYDKFSHSFKNATVSVWRFFGVVLRILLVSVAFTIIGYGLFALVFSSDTEKRLKSEKERLSAVYDRLSVEEERIGDVITGLQLKDAYIYEQVFQSEAPNVDPVGNLDFLFGSDTIPDRQLVSYTMKKAAELELRAERVDDAFGRIFAVLCNKGYEIPPMSSPVADITYPQIGAGKGEKVHPFYKTRSFHNGLDIIAQSGEPVLATADGTVTAASRSSRGQGNIVEISHDGGYLTRYEHLSQISVSKGQKIRRGQKIGAVGMSGQAFAPHLHYEVLADTIYLNPINYIFASVTPEEYSNMLFMAANTLQSMD